MSDSPEPPIPLTDHALKRWNALHEVHQFAAESWPAVAAYCAAFGRWVAAESHLAEHGAVMTITDDKGNVKSHGPSPQLAIAERAQKEMARLAATPALRRRV